MSLAWRYTALIRTDHVSELLKGTVAALRAQTAAPTQFVFVDSSRKPDVADELKALGGVVVPYPDANFNFSKAINIGVAAATEPYVLVISSHVQLVAPDVISAGVSLMQSGGMEVAYWRGAMAAGQTEIRTTAISPRTFNGYNGLSNTCAMLPRHRLLEHGFREEVFSAEDQAWAAEYFRQHQREVLRVEHPQLVYANPNVNARKTINEEIAIAYFAYRRGLWPDRILARVLRALLATVRGRPDRARMHWHIAKGLFSAWFKAPRAQSKYY